MRETLDELEFWRDLTNDYRISCPVTCSILNIEEKRVSTECQLVHFHHLIIITVVGNQVRFKGSHEFDFDRIRLPTFEILAL